MRKPNANIQDSCWRKIANPVIETLSQVILDVFASCERITAHPDGTRKWGYVRVGDDPTGI
jgi:hypothetical protein